MNSTFPHLIQGPTAVPPIASVINIDVSDQPPPLDTTIGTDTTTNFGGRPTGTSQRFDRSFDGCHTGALKVIQSILFAYIFFTSGVYNAIPMGSRFTLEDIFNVIRLYGSFLLYFF